MSEIRTSSWSAVLPKGAVRVGISRGTPRRLNGYRRFNTLEPGEWFRSVTPEVYLDLYRNLLIKLDPARIYDQLCTLGPSIVLSCWESATDCHAGETWCHRHLVAQWLEDCLGIEVSEIGHPNLDRFAHLRQRGISLPDYRASNLSHTQTTDYL